MPEKINSIKEKKVRDLMQTNVISVTANTRVIDLIDTMKERSISGVVVVDSAGDVLGVISSLDIFKIYRDYEIMDSLKAEDIMTPFSIDVTPEDSVVDAALAMLDNNIHRLVVTASPSQRKPIGIITSTDIINNSF